MKNYEVVFPIAIVVIVLIFLYFFFVKKKKSIGKNEKNFLPSNVSSNNPLVNIKFELLPSEQIDENQMIEIVDKQLLAKIDNYIPNVARAAQNANAAKNLDDVIKDNIFLMLENKCSNNN